MFSSILIPCYNLLFCTIGEHMNKPEKKSVEKPLWLAITKGCVLFIVLLCLILGLTSWLNYRRSLYQRYEAYIADILKYVDRHIDDDDLAQCVQTLEKSEKFIELEKFMDGIKEDFDIHYLYILTPIHKNGSGKMMPFTLTTYSDHDKYIWLKDEKGAKG